MEIKQDYKYLKTHEWIRVETGIAYVGISAPACEKLGELVYIDIPEVDTEVNKGDEVCVVESVKAASPLYAPVSGTIIQVNEELEDSPEQIQEDPYGIHIFAIRMSDESEIEQLLDAEAYAKVAEE
ncbi:MAG: glycine cleavage system protein GcvH [Spirochaetales bacterium]|nr:glycine cleavage system protein GcvH [Spirochaetales bacterium]